jgi:DtxR family Mn-dependent transcriptional regulator
MEMLNRILRRPREARRRIAIEDALKHMHACEWRDRAASIDSLAGALGISGRRAVRLCQFMEHQGLIRTHHERLWLRPSGRELALEVIRAHRLWERYLRDEARMPMAALHEHADRREHRRDAEHLHRMEAALGFPATDPHGDPIPTRDGRLPAPASRPLTDWPVDTPAVITHLEDEPRPVYLQILAEGLMTGLRIRIIEKTERRIVFTDGEDRHVLAPLIASNVSVIAGVDEPMPPETTVDTVPLTALRHGEEANVAQLDPVLRGYTRRRLLDLGLTAGARVSVAYRSFLGDPVAYRVRGSLVALRRDQAAHVHIRKLDSAGAGEVTDGKV